ncbi:MAG: M6 family metalloprotease domain-containing protein [candidate division Zixibacteria bacterium]|nr:M6 family metalloprotease domain-containing protein [candidate division Zixibacteria bacterium]
MITETIQRKSKKQQPSVRYRQQKRYYAGRPRPINVKQPRISLILVSLLFGMALGLIWVADVDAMPASPQLRQAISEGRITAPYYMRHEAELRGMGIDTPESGPLLTGINPLGKAALTGETKLLTILVDFSDKIAQVNAVKFDTLLYYNRTGTVVNYYLEVSHNNLTITTPQSPSDLGWIRAPQTYAYYVNARNGTGTYPYNSQKLVEDIVDLINPQVNFSQFDNDEDGFVDGLVIIHAGPGAEYTGSDDDIWSHQWEIIPRLRDGVYICAYSIQPEYWVSPGDMTCGVFCHELGHVFGLIDLYDTDYTSAGVGRWSLMAAGSWNGTLGSSPAHLDAYSKLCLGWGTMLTPALNLSEAAVPAVESEPIIYCLWTNGEPGNEYFLVENRQQVGYDACLPASGLFLWHIDDNVYSNSSEWWPGCGYSSHYKVALIQADGLWQLEHGANQGNAGDPFPGSSDVRQINGSGGLNTNSYSGAVTNVALTNISNSATEMTVDISVGAAQDIDDNENLMPAHITAVPNYPNPFNSSTNFRLDLTQAADVQIAIFNITGAKIKQITAGYLEPGTHSFIWDGTTDSGQKVGSGVYFYRLNINGESICKKMSLLK